MMDLAGKIREFKVTTIDEAVQLKDVLFQKEKGEALKRASTPRDEEEAASLGYFNAETGLTASFLKSIEQDINWLCNLGDDYSLSHAVDLFLRSTGSRNARRLEGVMGTIKDIKPDMNMGMNNFRGPPEFFGDNPPTQDNQNFKR